MGELSISSVKKCGEANCFKRYVKDINRSNNKQHERRMNINGATDEKFIKIFSTLRDQRIIDYNKNQFESNDDIQLCVPFLCVLK